MRHFMVFFLAVVVMLRALPASAQVSPVAPGRAYRGLFGGGTAGLRQSLTVQGSAGIGYSWRMLFGTTASQIGQPVQGTQIPVNSVFEHFGGSINYSLQLSRVNIGAAFGASTAIYPTINRPTYPAYHGNAGVSMPLWSGAMFRVGGGAIQQSWYDVPWQAGGLGAEQIGPVVDPILGLTGVLNPHVESHIEAGVTQRITSRLSLSGDYRLNRSHSKTRVFDQNSQSLGGHADYSLFKGLSLRAGYVESRHTFDPTLGEYRVHNFDGGVDFNRAFSFTRGVTITFSFGTAAVFYGNQVSYQLTGHAGLFRDIGRSWRASLLYDRGVSLDQTFGRPYESDQLNLNFGGMVNRRVRFNSGFGAMRAESLFGSTNGYEQSYGRIGLMTALTRFLGVSADYSYFAYRYDANQSLPFVTASRGDRNAIRVNLNVWAPLLAQGRRNVTR